MNPTGNLNFEAGEILTELGFEDRGFTEGGYHKWYHPDGSRVQIRPNGEVIRTGEKIGPNQRRRYGKDAKPRKQSEDHNTSEKLKD